MDMSEEYINGVFDSCKGITMPASGDLALDLACGPYTSVHCTPKLWVRVMIKCQNVFEFYFDLWFFLYSIGLWEIVR